MSLNYKMAQLGDAFANKSTVGGSAADEYYAWKLMADKMLLAQLPEGNGPNQLSADAKAVLTQVSQKERIKFAILAKISAPEYAESTANFAQLQAFAGGAKTKLAIAEALAEMVFEKERDELIMSNLVGPSRAYQQLMERKDKNGVTGSTTISAFLNSLVALV